MAFRSKTLRSMSPVVRRMARLIGEQESIARRWKNLLPQIDQLEADSAALHNHQCADVVKAAAEPLPFE